MKKQLVFAIISLVIVSISCSIQNVGMNTIETQEVTFSETLPGNLEETELLFQMTGGEFSIRPGAIGLVDGTIQYNVEQWEPQFTRSNYQYHIKQVDPFRFSGIPSGDVINQWDLALSNALPLDLTIEGGASDNNFDLSGLQLTNLVIRQGASQTIINFQQPNPIRMEDFSFTTGASSVEIYGLGNANFERMIMSAGAGDYTLDFAGTLTQDTVVEIKAGISNLTIVIPANMKAIVDNQGTVSNINSEGTWMLTDDTYTTLAEGYTLTINLDMAIGNVNLIHLD